MKDIKLYIEVVYYKDGTSSCNVYREYVKYSGSIKYDSLGIFKNNFLGMIRAKRRLTKFKKFHKRHKFDEVSDYSIVEKVIY